MDYREEIAARFSWVDYLACNADLAAMTPLQAVRHYITYGIYEPRQTDSKARLLDRRYALSGIYENAFTSDYPIQVIIHCYHFDVLCRMLSYLRSLARVGAVVRLVVANQSIEASALDDLLSSLYTGYRKHSWERVTNYGEDWSSFHHLFYSGAFSSRGATFKLQTKKSSNLGADGGMAWVDEALQPIASSYRATATVIKNLKAGTIKLAASKLCKRTGFGANPQLVAEYIHRLGLNEQSAKRQSFCMGSMFAADNDLIQLFYSSLGDVDYRITSDGGSQFCGRYPGHAIERAFFYYSYQALGDQSIVWLT
ncbi:hypothetical protein [Cyanobium sp. PCC 7001]|uniref:hypothetical protein n=1 Tax=Cyanobium sp. PCC 7001 TaxID=180281 RepID=UPI0018DCBA98|nr:hypothetical protein [Cyanobium sp. PCC 7001]